MFPDAVAVDLPTLLNLVAIFLALPGALVALVQLWQARPGVTR